MRMLTLFCGEGLACWGYWLSGRFHEIVGVDIADMSSSYSFDFVQGDALSLTYDFLMGFDFIHASPPCQGYSKMTPDQSKHPRLIAATHLMLKAAGKPHVIENVEGSGQELKPNLRLYGRDFGLPMHRPRYFHLNQMRASHLSTANDAHVSTRSKINEMIDDHQINVSTGDHPQMITRQLINALPGADMSIQDEINVCRAVHVHGGQYVNRDTLIQVFGLDCIPLKRRRLLTRDGIEQGIPPAMTKAIAEAMFPNYKAMIA